MKKIIGLIVFTFVCFSFFNSSVVFAKTQMLVNREGDTRQVEVSSNVWRTLTQIEEKAMKSPGKKIVLGKPEIKVERNFLKDFFHLTVLKTYNKIIVFNPKNNKFYYLSKKVTKKERKSIFSFFVFLFIGFGVMLYSNYRIKRYGFDNYIGVFVAAVTIIFPLAAIITIPPIIFFHFLFIILYSATLFAIFALFSFSCGKNIILYQFFSRSYCILIIIAIFFWFQGIKF